MTRHKSGRPRSEGKSCCQVCGVDLASIKAKEYCQKKRVCPEHLQADSVELPGKDCLHRFCHQCGRFEPLTLFDGVRRSCRDRLVLRRKPAASATAADSMCGTSSGPCSPSALQSQQEATAADTATLAAGSPEWSQHTGTAGDTGACSIFEDTSGWNVGAQREQVLQADLTSCTATPATLTAACALPGQQQYCGAGRAIDGNSVALGPAELVDESFDDVIAAVMEEEMQQCLREQQQQQQQQHCLQSSSSSLLMMPDLAAVAAPAMTTPLSAGYLSNALQDPVVGAGAISHHNHMTTSHFTPLGSLSNPCSHNGLLPEVDVIAGLTTHNTAQLSAPGAEKAASRREELLRQVHDLMQEEMMLRQVVTAAARTGRQMPALHPASCMLQGTLAPNRTDLPAQQLPAAAAPRAHPAGFTADFTGLLEQPPMLYKLPSTASTASLAVLPGDGINTGCMRPGCSQLGLQHQAVFARQQQELLVGERMQHLQAQFSEVATQLRHLKRIISGVAAGPAATMPAAPTTISYCRSSCMGPAYLQ